MKIFVMPLSYRGNKCHTFILDLLMAIIVKGKICFYFPDSNILPAFGLVYVLSAINVNFILSFSGVSFFLSSTILLSRDKNRSRSTQKEAGYGRGTYWI